MTDKSGKMAGDAPADAGKSPPTPEGKPFATPAKVTHGKELPDTATPAPPRRRYPEPTD